LKKFKKRTKFNKTARN